MAGKLSILVGFGAGYVLGARAGRARYEQITSRARQAWQDPRVQQRAVRVQNLVPGTLAPGTGTGTGTGTESKTRP